MLTMIAALWPAIAHACPYCAGRSGGGIGTGIVLGSFVLLPFPIVWMVYRIIRAEARLEEVAGQRAGAKPAPTNGKALFSHNRSRREE
ncbi:MAG: hypothetical protein ABJE95_14125 [Byssovorax sp.]